MIIEQLRPMGFRLTLHALELATLISAARRVAREAHGELTDEARDQLEPVLASYDRQRTQVAPPSPQVGRLVGRCGLPTTL